MLTGSAGLTVTGAAINLNDSSNFAVNIGTGSSTGTVTLGGTGTQTIAVGNGQVSRLLVLVSTTTSSTTTINGGTGDITLNSTDQIKLSSSKAAGGTTTEAFSLKTSTDLGAADEIFQLGDSAADFWQSWAVAM